MGVRGLIYAAALSALTTTASAAQGILTNAIYEDPTTRYDHGILGDAIEWGTLRLTVNQCPECDNPQLQDFVLRLPKNRVFEDFAPRLVPVDNAQGPAAMVIETDLNLGARLALYDQTGLIAATPFIGRTHRWLSPIGAADLDGDGHIEYAYVDRPHLAKTIRVWRLNGDTLDLVDELPGVTNHRIGEDNVAGGIRNCGNGPEMIVTDANWRDILAVRFSATGFTTRSLGPQTGRGSFQQALDCQN